MKKIIALLLALIMVMGLATVVSAATSATAVPVANDAVITLTKEYKEGTADSAVKPDEAPTFTVSKSNDNIPVEVDTSDYKNGNIKVTIKDCSALAAGQYTITLTENAPTAMAIAKDEDTVVLNMFIYYGTVDGQRALVKDIALGNNNKNTKDDTFTNTYTLHDLTVGKTVSGNLADQTTPFDIKVKFAAPEGKTVASAITYTYNGEEKTISAAEINAGKEVVVSIAHGGSVVFKNIPEGVTYTVIEDSKHTEKETGWENDKTTGYTFGNQVESATAITADATVTVTNEKEAELPTGIAMDSVPFIVMAVIAVLGVAAITVKKRVQE